MVVYCVVLLCPKVNIIYDVHKLGTGQTRRYTHIHTKTTTYLGIQPLSEEYVVRSKEVEEPSVLLQPYVQSLPLLCVCLRGMCVVCVSVCVGVCACVSVCCFSHLSRVLLWCVQHTCEVAEVTQCERF